MQAIDLVTGKSLEEPIGQHGARSAQSFLGGLEDEDGRAGEVARLGEIAGRPEENRGVPVMPAGMALARVHRGPGRSRLFLDRQGVHVGAQAYPAIAFALALELADDARSADVPMHRDAPGSEQIRHDA